MPTKPAPQTATKTTPLTPQSFLGFAPPTSNTTYTPNQFFDVVLPHASRGCVRLVAYMIRKTLGWCDADGNPQEEQLHISYADLVNHAGIGRARIREVLDEAIESRFIRCVREPRPSAARTAAVTGLYELRWDIATEYVRDPDRFAGFFEREGNRTDIPNEFFDEIVPREALSVIKVVGAVIRFSIGFQARRGRRRQQAALSYSAIQRFANLHDRTTLSEAIQRAQEANYILRVSDGVFTADRGLQMSTRYALKWLDPDFYLPTGPRTRPEEHLADRFQNPTRTGPKSRPENRFQNQTIYKRNKKNETLQTQQQPAADFQESVDLLKANGFAVRDAETLAASHPTDRIRAQVNWLKRRQPSRNPVGMLRRAIEEDWPEPATPPGDIGQTNGGPGALFAAHFYAGFHGNNDAPTAVPSANDVNHAERYVARLLEVNPEQSRISEWGRALGQVAAKSQQHGERRVISCVAAIRSHGDEIYTSVRRQHEQARHETIERAREEHRRRFEAQHLDFLRGEEARITSEQPETHLAFEQHRGEERARIETSRFLRDDQRTKLLAHFDSDASRLKSLQVFFRGEVLDFWSWDARFNRERFDENSLSL